MEVCRTCKFYEMEKKGDTLGVCRRFPPVLTIWSSSDTGTFDVYSDWRNPEVFDDEWCGEFKQKSDE